MQSTEKLISGIKQGEERYFNLIFTRYFRHLLYFASQYLDDSAEAENVVQDTFITLWNKRKNLTATTEAGLLSFLYTVLKNNCYHALKKSRKQSEQKAQWLKEQEQIDMVGLVEMDTSEDTFSDMYRIIQETLQELPPQCRTVFELSRFEGLKNREIAEKLGITEKAVEGNITRGLKVFRKALKSYMPQMLIFLKL